MAAGEIRAARVDASGALLAGPSLRPQAAKSAAQSNAVETRSVVNALLDNM
jgi:hypothetical protein